jgi:flagellar basal body rod protein FlgC
LIFPAIVSICAAFSENALSQIESRAMPAAHLRVMPDAMAIAASGLQAGMTALSQAAADVAAEPAPAPACGFALGFNPSAPSANLQDLVAMPPVDPATAITGQIEAANGVRTNLVVYRVAAHMYRSLLRL